MGGRLEGPPPRRGDREDHPCRHRPVHGRREECPMSGEKTSMDHRRREGTLFDVPRPGRTGVLLPALDVPAADPGALFGAAHRPEVSGEVEASEVDVVRHFTRLSLLLSLIHISEPTRLGMISYAVF